MSIGITIYQFIYRQYDFCNPSIIFGRWAFLCLGCRHELNRLFGEAHIITCECGMRYVMRRVSAGWEGL